MNIVDMMMLDDWRKEEQRKEDIEDAIYMFQRAIRDGLSVNDVKNDIFNSCHLSDITHSEIDYINSKI